jgi:hypothetical protein
VEVHAKFQILTYSDGKEMLQREEKLIKEGYKSSSWYLASDQDVIAALEDSHRQMPIYIKTEHVKGHQDKDKAFEQLTILVFRIFLCHPSIVRNAGRWTDASNPTKTVAFTRDQSLWTHRKPQAIKATIPAPRNEKSTIICERRTSQHVYVVRVREQHSHGFRRVPWSKEEATPPQCVSPLESSETVDIDLLTSQ